ncbi:hypothetical protein RvY_18700 [Ramazzottius varieornatus]|uniref:Peptidase M14 domain-containing protein n=1 Tax=Ramazzottius varieornatus TaxID=947166 RepID=A0A1D1W858_RAMVA|nr:hypothetical protein RvY_18700 [Ramazzottius varieornatus]
MSLRISILRHLAAISTSPSRRKFRLCCTDYVRGEHFTLPFLYIVFTLSVVDGLSTHHSSPFQYNNYLELTTELQHLNRLYPNETKLYSLGKSERGREMWVLMLAAEANKERPLGRPAVKLVGNMHGNEPVGRSLLIHFAHHILKHSKNDSTIGTVMETTEIHLLPTMNPDGFESAEEGTCSGTKGRYNSRGADLNRNFPDFMRKNFVRREKETKNVIKWLKNHRFVLSANFHGGAVVASYPWDNYAGYSQVPKLTLTEDHDVFYYLANGYAQRHLHMHTGLSCGDYFEGGVTNGAGWFPLTGGMQDFNYVVAGVMEITLEVSCCKYPPRSMLKHFWEENKEAMVEFVQSAQLGVKGLVLDEEDRPIPHSFVTVQGRSMEFETTERGEFWRLLLPGNYTLRAFASGHYDEVMEVSFGNMDMPYWVEFHLKKKYQHGEFMPPQVFNEVPLDFPTVAPTTMTITMTTPEGTKFTTPTDHPGSLSATTATTRITTTQPTKGAASTVTPSSTSPTVSSTVASTTTSWVFTSSSTSATSIKLTVQEMPATERPILVLPEKDLHNTIQTGPALGSPPITAHVVYPDSADAAVRRILPERLSDPGKVISQLRVHKPHSFFQQFSAGLAPRTKYHRRVLESLFPFAVANMEHSPRPVTGNVTSILL